MPPPLHSPDTPPTLDIDFRSLFQIVSDIHETAKREGSLHMTVHRVCSLVARGLHIPECTLTPFHSTVAAFVDILHGAPLRFMVPPHSPACPIASLPVEILSSIFHHVVVEWEEHASIAVLRHESLSASRLVGFLHSVTSVCRFWRRVAFGCPALWSNIFGLHGPQYGTRWTTALALSGATPLKIWDNGPYEFVPLTIFSVALRNHEHRIRYVDTLDNPFIYDATPTLTPATRWSALRSLNIVNGYGTIGLRQMLSPFKHSLLHLRLSDFTPTLHYTGDAPLIMLSLQRLVIDFHIPNELERFLLLLRCPAVLDLVLIRNVKPYRNEYLPLLQEIGPLRDHFASLRTLSLSGDLSAESALAAIVRFPHVSSLKLFDLRDTFCVDDIITSLLYGGCLPLLQSLYVDESSPQLYSPTIKQLLQDRDHHRSFGQLSVSLPIYSELVKRGYSHLLATHGITLWRSPEQDFVHSL